MVGVVSGAQRSNTRGTVRVRQKPAIKENTILYEELCGERKLIAQSRVLEIAKEEWI